MASSEQRDIPHAPPAPTVSEYEKYQQQRPLSQAPAGYGEERYQKPSTTETQPIEYQQQQQKGYGVQGGGGREEEEYFTPAPIGMEKGTGYSQQKQTQFAADPSLMTSTERSERSDIPQSPERQSQSWTESIKNTVRNVTGAGSHTSTH